MYMSFSLQTADCINPSDAAADEVSEATERSEDLHQRKNLKLTQEEPQAFSKKAASISLSAQQQPWHLPEGPPVAAGVLAKTMRMVMQTGADFLPQVRARLSQQVKLLTFSAKPQSHRPAAACHVPIPG